MTREGYLRKGPLQPTTLEADNLPEGAKRLAKKGLRDNIEYGYELFNIDFVV